LRREGALPIVAGPRLDTPVLPPIEAPSWASRPRIAPRIAPGIAPGIARDPEQVSSARIMGNRLFVAASLGIRMTGLRAGVPSFRLGGTGTGIAIHQAGHGSWRKTVAP